MLFHFDVIFRRFYDYYLATIIIKTGATEMGQSCALFSHQPSVCRPPGDSNQSVRRPLRSPLIGFAVILRTNDVLCEKSRHFLYTGL